MYDEMFLQHASEPREPDWDEEAYADDDLDEGVCDLCGRIIRPDAIDDVGGLALCEGCRAETENET